MFTPPLADIPFPLIIITYTTRCVETFDKENLSCRQRFNNEIIARKGKKKKKTRDDLTVKKERKKEISTNPRVSLRSLERQERFPRVLQFHSSDERRTVRTNAITVERARTD